MKRNLSALLTVIFLLLNGCFSKQGQQEFNDNLAGETRVSASLQNNINKLKDQGKIGTILQQMVMQRAEGIAPHNRPYVFDGVGDCYGYVRQVWNAILYDGNVHSEDFYPKSYNKSRWHNITGGLPVGTAPDSDWALITDRNQLLPGDVLSTHQGHAWGSQWHGGLYAGVENGVHKQWDCASSGGAYKRNFYSGFKYYFKPLHDLLKNTTTIIYPQYPGLHRLIAKHSGKVIDVQYGGMDNGVNIWQWPINNDGAQHWEITHIADGYYSFKNQKTGKFMGVENAGTTNGTNVRQWEWTGTCAQLWQILNVETGYYKLVNKCSNRVIDVEGGVGATQDGANIQIWEPLTGVGNQLWKLQSVQ